MQNIFVYEAIEITERESITTIPYQMLIRKCETENIAAATEKIQKVAVMIHVRFKVAICLYLIPNNRERSLSGLMAVNVNKDTKYNA